MREIKLDEAVDMIIRFYAELFIAGMLSGVFVLLSGLLLKAHEGGKPALIFFICTCFLFPLTIPLCLVRLWLKVRAEKKTGGWVNGKTKAVCIAALLIPGLGFAGLSVLTYQVGKHVKDLADAKRAHQ